MYLLTLVGFLLPVKPEAPSEVLAPCVEHATAESPAKGELFAPASEDLSFTWAEGAEGPSILDVVLAYGAVTDQRLAIEPDTQALLDVTPAALDRPVTIPAADVQGFVESMLRASECVLTIDWPSPPRLVGVHALRSHREVAIRARAMKIDCSQIDVLRRHPAVLFATVVHLPHSDIRQLSNSLRSLISNANTSAMLPAGVTHSMVITGYGTNVADQVEILQAIDAANKRTEVDVDHVLIQLEHGIATDMAPLVARALNTSRQLRTQGSKNLQLQPGPNPGDVSVVADARLNRLLVTCPTEDMKEARTLVARLDVE